MEDKAEFLFGSPYEKEIEQLYARYAMGDPLEIIAADAGKSVKELMAQLRRMPEKYEETEKARAMFTGTRLRRTLSLMDAHNLQVMEDLRTGRLMSEEKVEAQKHIAKLANGIFTRLQLHEGKATEILKIEDKRMTIPELKDYIQKIEEAGDGICRE